jgi:hypothetical protein
MAVTNQPINQSTYQQIKGLGVSVLHNQIRGLAVSTQKTGADNGSL